MCFAANNVFDSRNSHASSPAQLDRSSMMHTQSDTHKMWCGISKFEINKDEDVLLS